MKKDINIRVKYRVKMLIGATELDITPNVWELELRPCDRKNIITVSFFVGS